MLELEQIRSMFVGKRVSVHHTSLHSPHREGVCTDVYRVEGFSQFQMKLECRGENMVCFEPADIEHITTDSIECRREGGHRLTIKVID